MHADITFRDAECYPNGSFIHIVAVHHLDALADQLHVPYLVRIGDRKRFAARAITVGVHQVAHHPDRFARGFGPLQGRINQRPVVDDSRRVPQSATAERAFGDNQLVLVHVADGRIGFGYLCDFTEVFTGIPFIHGHHRAGWIFCCRMKIEASVQLVRVGCVGNHRRAVLGGPFRYENVRAGFAFESRHGNGGQK